MTTSRPPPNNNSFISNNNDIIIDLFIEGTNHIHIYLKYTYMLPIEGNPDLTPL